MGVIKPIRSATYMFSPTVFTIYFCSVVIYSLVMGIKRGDIIKKNTKKTRNVFLTSFNKGLLENIIMYDINRIKNITTVMKNVQEQSTIKTMNTLVRNICFIDGFLYDFTKNKIKKGKNSILALLN